MMTTMEEGSPFINEDPLLHREDTEEDGGSVYMESLDEEEEDQDIYTRPIVVGYAFGPKKMSTMGVVMAEASKTKLSRPGTLHFLKKSSTREESGVGLLDTSDSLSQESPRRSNIVFTMDEGPADNSSTNDLRNIVRHFRTTCSSVASSTATAATGSLTATSTVVTAATTAVASSSHEGQQPTQWVPVRVSFVPLDPDIPLEEQHGGQMDIILHKLTEDILCLSRLTMEHPELDRHSAENLLLSRCQPTEQDAVRRVHRLRQFKQQHPGCCLVDDPANVQILMSRSDIARTLRQCLRGVTSTSGVPVESPAYAVMVRPSPEEESFANKQSRSWADEQVTRAKLSFPLVVKPLTAAGTHASHAMAIVLEPSSLDSVVQEKAPCLCQEFANHDGFLYKVYVLGDHVTVHRRRSLPNLPRCQDTLRKSRMGFVEFDSQRPYPRFRDFGFPEDGVEKVAAGPTSDSPSKIVMTVEEVMPIVDALKAAFGLELFGFDILLAGNDDHSSRRKMMIVDVNYFPSYKEVSNFPALLAKYLTDRAIESRRRANIPTGKPV